MASAGAEDFPNPTLCGEGEKCRLFFADARKAEAFVPTEEELRRFFSSCGAEVTDADGREAVDALLSDRLSLCTNAGPSVLLNVLAAGDDERFMDTGEALVIVSDDVSVFEFGIATEGGVLS